MRNSPVLLNKSLIMISLVKQKFDKIDDLQKFFCQRCAGVFFSGQNLSFLFSNKLQSKNLISSITVHFRLIFVFHKNEKEFVRSKVCPPRLGGRKVGLFSTRSPHRPNPIGLSLAKLDRVDGITRTIDLYNVSRHY